jgi:hypothetical protein
VRQRRRGVWDGYEEGVVEAGVDEGNTVTRYAESALNAQSLDHAAGNLPADPLEEVLVRSIRR